MVKIIIINNYGQFCHLIFRAIRDMDIDVEMLKNTASVKEILSKKPSGIILGGGPSIERIGNCIEYIKKIDVPILGICLGHQIITKAYGGEVKKGNFGGYASVEIEIIEKNELFKGFPDKIKVWASHSDEVDVLPKDFKILAKSDICEIEAMKHIKRPLYGIQWHPEVSHTEFGYELFNNFFEICDRNKI